MTAFNNLFEPPKFFNRTGVLTLSGFGVRVLVRSGQLEVEYGAGLDRRKLRLARAGSGLRRLICIGNDGFITLDALRWISGIGASFALLDRRGKVVTVCGPSAPSESRLRRAQSLALGNGTALRISKELISQKLNGQAALVRDPLRAPATAEAIVELEAKLASAENIETVRLIEARCAKLYWREWSNIPVHWPRKDERRVPENWKKFNSRVSPLTGSPRLAATPPCALLNFLYSLLEAEARLSAVVMGLDPAIGCLHVDTNCRDSLASDLMEVCRPDVDAFVLHLLQNEPLRRADFFEDSNGNCRLVSALAIKLCETANTWRTLVAPVAEYVAKEIWDSIPKAKYMAGHLIATRLTQRNKRKVKGSDVPPVKIPKPDSVCYGCGATTQGGRHCSKCGREMSREKLIELAKLGRMAAKSSESRKKHSATQFRHEAAKRAWRSSPKPDWPDENTYVGQIQPRLLTVTISALASTLGVSEPYAALIRAGRHRPHPRHWQVLAQLVGVSPES